MLIAGTACASSLWAKSHWDRTRISAITDEIGRNSDEAVDFIHEEGLVFVEVRNLPGANKEYATGREADVQADAAHFVNEKVRVSCVDTTLLKFAWPGSDPAQKVEADQARWDRRMDDLRKALRCAQIMGADKVRIFAGSRAADPAAMLQRAADTIGEMAAEAERQKISLLVENDSSTNVATCAEMTALMKLAPSKFLGINWCPYNCRELENPFPEGYALLPKKRILNVRAHTRCLMPGADALNWKTILMALDKDGYAGKVTLETGATGADRIAAARDSMDQLEHVVREVS